MTMENNNGASMAGVKTFVRNRYFYGKMLDVLQFELEQNYFNAKRWLHNRMVTGYGVLCGLDVEVGKDGASVVVLPGIAIDKWGREIIVPGISPPVPLPPAPAPMPEGEGVCDDADCFHLVLCYHECQTDPVPALGGDCDQNALCSPGAIRERYELSFQRGRVPHVSVDCTAADLLSGSRINYAALADYVSRPFDPGKGDPCIPLANVTLPASGKSLEDGQIDIAIRPIVYTNDLLHDLLVCLTTRSGTQEHRSGK
jgi:hypothetical protein